MWDEEEDPDFDFGGSAPLNLGRARPRRPKPRWEQPPVDTVPDETQDPQPRDLQSATLAKLDADDDAQRQALTEEIVKFIEQMRAHSLPGVRRITITDGYKKGLRYLLTPKYSKENHVVVAGWTLYVRDIKVLRDNPDWHKLLDVQAFAITVDGEILDRYLWFPYGGSGLKKVSVSELSGTAASKQRWYLRQLMNNLLNQ